MELLPDRWFCLFCLHLPLPDWYSMGQAHAPHIQQMQKRILGLLRGTLLFATISPPIRIVYHILLHISILNLTFLMQNDMVRIEYTEYETDRLR